MKADIEKEMTKSVEQFQKELSRIRTDRVTPDFLSPVQVDYYGSMVPLHQVATVVVEGARSLVINPWEKQFIGVIERAISQANLGVTPSSNDEVVRINLPPLTEETRLEYAKQAKQIAERFRIGIRNIRKHFKNKVKQLHKDEEISEDEESRRHTMIQTLTDEYIKTIDGIASDKEKELMGK